MNNKMGMGMGGLQRMGMGMGRKAQTGPAKNKGRGTTNNEAKPENKDIDQSHEPKTKKSKMGMGEMHMGCGKKDQSSSESQKHMGCHASQMGHGMGVHSKGRDEQENEAKYHRSLGQSVITSLVGQTTTSLTVDTAGGRTDSDNFSVLVSFLSYGGTGAASCADSLGNSYSIAAHVVFNTNFAVTLFYVTGKASLIKNTVITVTHPSSTRRIVIADEFKGLLATGAADQVASAFASSAATFATSGMTALTTQKNELVYGVIGVNGPAIDSFKKEHKWTLLHDRGTLASDGNDIRLITGFRPVNKADTYEFSGNLGVARLWGAITQSFKSDGGGSDIDVDV